MFFKEKNDCDEAEKSDDSCSPKVPTRYVMGRQRDLVFVEPPFHLKPIDKDGRELSSENDGKRLKDQGSVFGLFGLSTKEPYTIMLCLSSSLALSCISICAHLPLAHG